MSDLHVEGSTTRYFPQSVQSNTGRVL